MKPPDSHYFFIFDKVKAALLVAVICLFSTFSNHSALAQSPIRISEVLPDNKSGISDPDGKKSDWFEIQNISEKSIQLSDYGVSDHLSQKDIWRLPNKQLPPGDCLIFFANGKKTNAPFKLSAQGESLWIFKFEKNREQSKWIKISHFHFPDMDEDQAYGYSKSGLPGYLELPSPGLTNSRVKKIWLTKNSFDITPPSGLFIPTEKIQPHILNEYPSIEIRYTTDGTSPENGTSKTWNAGTEFTITETTTIRFGFFDNGVEVAPQQARSYLFLNNLFLGSGEYDKSKMWPKNWGRNATYYGPDQELIDEWGWDEKLSKAFSSIPIFSVIVDPMDLFDYENGIYSNAPMKGRNWERHCILEYIPHGELKNGQSNAGIRIRGGFSRSTRNPKHSFRFFFRKSYGEPKFRYDLFPEYDGTDEFDHLDLRCSQNYSWSFQRDPRAVFIRDQFNRDLQLQMNRPAARGDFCHLFINGLYWGLYNSSERPEASYGNSYIGGKKKNFDVIKSAGFNWAGRYTGMPDDRPKGPSGFTMHIEATDGNLDAWNDLWRLTNEGNGMKDMLTYAYAIGKKLDGTKAGHNPLLDPGNLADYMLIILSMGNKDAPLTSGGDRPNNWYAIRNRNSSEGFQFFIWDAEHSVLSYDIHQDRTGPYLTGDNFEYSNPQYLWEQCIKNPEFRFLIKDRVHLHFNKGGSLHHDTLIKLWDKRVREIYFAVVAESARWGSGIAQNPSPWNILNREDHWVPSVNAIRENYLPYRLKVIYGQLQAAGLAHTLPLPKVHSTKQFTVVTIPGSLSKSGAQLTWTKNGKDPRSFGGQIHSDAQTGKSMLRIKSEEIAEVVIRIKLSQNWGPLLRFVK